MLNALVDHLFHLMHFRLNMAADFSSSIRFVLLMHPSAQKAQIACDSLVLYTPAASLSYQSASCWPLCLPGKSL